VIVYKSREADLSGTAPISAIIGILFECTGSLQTQFWFDIAIIPFTENAIASATRALLLMIPS